MDQKLPAVGSGLKITPGSTNGQVSQIRKIGNIERILKPDQNIERVTVNISPQGNEPKRKITATKSPVGPTVDPKTIRERLLKGP